MFMMYLLKLYGKTYYLPAIESILLDIRIWISYVKLIYKMVNKDSAALSDYQNCK